MNFRNATLMERRRKNIKFEQERVASLDYDVQRAGGLPKKDSSAKPKQESKGHKPSHKSDS
jgi:hypothetical protein